MSLFSTFALGAAQGAAQGLVQGAVSRMQMDMDEAKARIQEARDKTMLEMQQKFQREMTADNQMFQVTREDENRRFQEQQASEGRNYQSMERENERSYQSGEKEKDRTHSSKLNRENIEAGKYQSKAGLASRLITGNDGSLYTMDENNVAQPVKTAEGTQLRSAKNLSESDKMELISIRSQIQTMMKNTPMGKKAKEEYDRQLQELRRAEARLTGRSPASAAPSSTDDFLNSVLGAKG